MALVNIPDSFVAGYMGNSKLKRAGEAVEWTAERVKELVKCKDDEIYFARNYMKIVHVDKGLIPLDLYDYQSEIISKVLHNRNTIVVTARQAGKTTTAVAIILHYILFNEHKTVALLANKGDTAREILARVKLAYEELPKWLQQGVIEWNKGSIELENGCKVLAGATSSSAIRGKSISFLYVDEMAFVENWDEFFASVYPTISSGKKTKMLLTSTPNGLNHFYKFFVNAEEGRNGYAHIKVTWDQVPGRDEAWKQSTLASLNNDLEQFRVEFECQFLGSSGTLISSDALKSLVFKDPIAESAGIKQFHTPIKGHTYALMADVSHGKGLDYSTFSIIDITTMPYVQVATFRDNYIGPVDFANVIFRMGTLYNNAYVLIELNDIGPQVSDTLYMDLGYEEMLFTENAGRTGKRLSSGFSSRGVDRGLRVTKSTKANGCNIFKMLVEQQQIVINDFSTIQEMATFSKKGASYEAEPGCHDDTVMPLVNFAWLTTQSYFKELCDINTLSRLREKTDEELMNEMIPFGIIDDGSSGLEDVPIAVSDNDNSWLF